MTRPLSVLQPNPGTAAAGTCRIVKGGWRWGVQRLLDRGFGKVPRAVEEDGQGETIRIKLERAKAARATILRTLVRIGHVARPPLWAVHVRGVRESLEKMPVSAG